MFIKARKYRQVEGTTSASVGTSSSSEIKIDIEEYNKRVNNISTQTDKIIQTYSGYVEPDSVCKLNSVIPDYEQADHEVEDLLRLLKVELKKVVKVMNEIRADYEKVDEEKSQEAATNLSDPSGRASGGSSN